MPEWPHQSEAGLFYGNPRRKNGEANIQWVDENIVKVTLPWQLSPDFRISMMTTRSCSVRYLYPVSMQLLLDDFYHRWCCTPFLTLPGVHFDAYPTSLDHAWRIRVT